jgi:hypothetical protein
MDSNSLIVNLLGMLNAGTISSEQFTQILSNLPKPTTSPAPHQPSPLLQPHPQMNPQQSLGQTLGQLPHQIQAQLAGQLQGQLQGQTAASQLTVIPTIPRARSPSPSARASTIVSSIRQPRIQQTDTMSTFAMGFDSKPELVSKPGMPSFAIPPSNLQETPTEPPAKRPKLKLINTKAAVEKAVPSASLTAMGEALFNFDTPIEPKERISLSVTNSITPMEPIMPDFQSIPDGPSPGTIAMGQSITTSPISRSQHIYEVLATQGPCPSRMSWCKRTGIIALSCRISTLVTFEECGPCGMKAGGRAHPDMMFLEGGEVSKTWKMGRVACRVKAGDPHLDPHRDPTLADHVAIHIFRPSFPSLTETHTHAPGTPGFFTSVREAHQHHSNRPIHILEWNDTGDLLFSADSAGRIVVWYSSPHPEPRHADPIPNKFWRGGSITDWKMLTMYDVDSIRPTTLPLVVAFKWFVTHPKHHGHQYVYAPKATPPMAVNVTPETFPGIASHASQSFVKAPATGCIGEEKVGAFGFILLTRFGRIRCFKGLTTESVGLSTWANDIPNPPQDAHVVMADVMPDQHSYLIASLWSKNKEADVQIEQFPHILITKCKVDLAHSRLTLETQTPIDLTPLKEKLGPTAFVLHLKWLTPSHVVIVMSKSIDGPTMVWTLNLETASRPGDVTPWGYDLEDMLTGGTSDVTWHVKASKMFPSGAKLFPTSLDIVSMQPNVVDSAFDKSRCDATVALGWSDGTVSILEPESWEHTPPCMRIMDPPSHRDLRGQPKRVASNFATLVPPGTPVVCNDDTAHMSNEHGIPQACIGSPNGVEVLALRIRSFNLTLNPGYEKIVEMIHPVASGLTPPDNREERLPPRSEWGKPLTGIAFVGMPDLEEEIVVSRVPTTRLPKPPSPEFVLEALSRMFTLAALNHYEAEDVTYRCGVMDSAVAQLFNVKDLVERVWDRVHVMFDGVLKLGNATSLTTTLGIQVVEKFPDVLSPMLRDISPRLMEIMGIQMGVMRSLGGTHGLVPLVSSDAIHKAIGRHMSFCTTFVQFQLIAIARAFLNCFADHGSGVLKLFDSLLLDDVKTDVASQVANRVRTGQLDKNWETSFPSHSTAQPDLDKSMVMGIVSRVAWVLDLVHLLHRQLLFSFRQSKNRPTDKRGWTDEETTLPTLLPIIYHAPSRNLLIKVMILVRLYRIQIEFWLTARPRLAQEEETSLKGILEMLDLYGEPVMSKLFAPTIVTIGRRLDEQAAKEFGVKQIVQSLKYHVVRSDLFPSSESLKDMVRQKWMERGRVLALMSLNPDGSPLVPNADVMQMLYKSTEWLEIGKAQEDDVSGVDRVYCGDYEEASLSKFDKQTSLTVVEQNNVDDRWDVITKQPMGEGEYRQCLRCRHYSGFTEDRVKIYLNGCSCGGLWRTFT